MIRAVPEFRSRPQPEFTSLAELPGLSPTLLEFLQQVDNLSPEQTCSEPAAAFSLHQALAILLQLLLFSHQTQLAPD